MQYNVELFEPLYQSLIGNYVKFSIARDWDAVEAKQRFFYVRS